MSFFTHSSQFQTVLCAGQHANNRATFADQQGLFLKNDQTSKLQLTLYSSMSEHTDPTTPATQDSQETGSDDVTLTESTLDAEECLLQTTQDVRNFFTQQESGWVVLHVGQERSFACLDMTREVFNQLSGCVEVFPALRDTILNIGFRRRELEVAPPPPRVHMLSEQGPSVSAWGVEVSYGLRFMEANGSSTRDPWSSRQCVIYNKVDHSRDAVRWLFVSVPTLLKRQIRSYMEGHVGTRMPSPFEIHGLVLTTLIPMWRPYLVQVQSTLERYKVEILMSKPDGHGETTIDGDMSLELKNIEDDLQDAMLAIKATQNTIKVLQKLYNDICSSQAGSIGSHNHHQQQQQQHPTLGSIGWLFAERLNDTELLVEQVTTLINKTRNSSQIVSTFLNLENGHILRDLASKTRDEGQALKSLSETATRDAKAVKALSLITVIFLPVTVVLNFFSASFVDASDGTIRLVGKWWLFLAAGLPLTILTLLVWSLWILKIKRDSDSDNDTHSQKHRCLPFYRSSGGRDLEKNAAHPSHPAGLGS